MMLAGQKQHLACEQSCTNNEQKFTFGDPTEPGDKGKIGFQSSGAQTISGNVHTLCLKKRPTLSFALTLTNIDGFSKFLQ